MNTLIILFPTQLFEQKYMDKITEDCKKNVSLHICLWENSYFFTKYPYHKKKLIFHRASMKYYYDSLPKKYKKIYSEYLNDQTINEYIKKNKIDQIRFFNPIEKELINLIMENKIFTNTMKYIYPSPYFLNSTNFSINEDLNLKNLKHVEFYKSQRIKYKIMIRDENNTIVPEGSKWSFDTENRKPFEKNQIEPELLEFKSEIRTRYLNEAKKYISKNFSKHYGEDNLENFIYPINRKESIKWLENFITNKLENFGKYEDAMSSKILFGFHSVLSPMLNIGLITPLDIITSIKEYKSKNNKNLLASKEGFIRQVIGWREYCYFTYDLFGDKLETTSLYSKISDKTHIIPQKVWASNTQIPPIDDILKKVNIYGYSHHIERLMGIGNFLILIRCDIKSIYDWFQTMYIDAYDVFMTPNIYGMLGFGKLDEIHHMMTRPYFASSNYIMKMSNYKSTNLVSINNITYKWDEILDALFWSHVDKYSNEFKKNYSTSSMVAKWNNFDTVKKKHIKKLTEIYINWIHKL
jgi:deoxyribodipyrimidine photolyase-related protein